MLNTQEIYFDAGYKAGLCRVRRDEAGYQFHNNWFRRAKALEKDENKQTAQASYDAGYAEAQPVRKPEYFR